MKKVIVIGSGFGGLAVAIRLQARGFNVTVMEKNEQVGGHSSQLVKDGYIFAYIRYGGKVMMPSYRENISKEQAWQVVNYVRHLQSQSN